MYYDYFGLSEAPFSIAPNPDYLFMTDRHQEALAHLYHSVESDAGFVLLTGDVGTGKTTVCRSFLDNLPKDTEVAFILNPFLSGRELLMMICEEFNIGPQAENATLRQLTNTIYTYLLDNHAVGKQSVLLIDEAQHLHFKVLELIRLLTNLETDRQKLLKIVLVGQPELNDSLAKPELTQLSQRITARYHIKPLNRDETGAYIDYRLRMAGYLSEKKIFPKSIVDKIFRATHGVPRLINVICDRALLGTYSRNRAAVDKSILNKALVEVRGEQKLAPSYHKWWFAGAAIISLLLGMSVFLNYSSFVGSSPLTEKLSALLVTEQPLPENNNTAITDNNKNLLPIAENQNETESNTTTIEVNQNSVVAEEKGAEKKGAEEKDVPVPIVSRHAIAYYVDRESAVKDLIKKVRQDSSAQAQTCNGLVADGWQCRITTVESWQLVQSYNRPAVITLVNDSGESYYLPILGMNSTSVDVLTPKGEKRLRLDDLRDEWTGELIYLWQPPRNFVNNIFFDADATLVNWLANAFALIDQREEVLAKDQFNSLLKKRVMLFQRENELIEDGIAGIQTLLKINEKLGVAVTLKRLEEQSASNQSPVNTIN